MEEVDYCSKPELVRVFPEIRRELVRLRNAGWLLVMITNQSGIGRGYFSVDAYEAVNRELFRQLEIEFDGVYFCPDAPGLPSERRKPAPGMVREACEDLDIDPAGSWFVGDKDADVECGKRAGCRTILVLTGYGSKHEGVPADHVAEDAASAARWILQEESRD